MRLPLRPQGEEGINFYIVVEGSPIVTVADANGKIEVERRLAPGDTFGEVALLAGTARTASVRAGSEKACTPSRPSCAPFSPLHLNNLSAPFRAPLPARSHTHASAAALAYAHTARLGVPCRSSAGLLGALPSATC